MQRLSLLGLAIIFLFSACQKRKTKEQEMMDMIDKMIAADSTFLEPKVEYPRDPDLCTTISLHKPGETKVDSLLAAGHKADCNCRVGRSRMKGAARIPIVKAFVRNKYKHYSVIAPSAHVAVENGDKDMIKKLVEAGADLNRREAEDRSAVELAVSREDGEMLDFLLELGGDPKQINLEHCGDAELIDKLIEMGADGKNVDINIAFRPCSRKLLKKLLAYEPEIKRLDYFGVMHSCDPVVLEDLLDYGISPEVPDRGGQESSLLIETMQRRKTKHVELLLQRGADVNFRDWRGYTPLYVAVDDRDEKMVKRLLEMGADPKDGEENFRNLMERAIRRGNGKIVRMLDEKDAKVKGGDNLGYAEKHKAKDEVIVALKKNDAGR